MHPEAFRYLLVVANDDMADALAAAMTTDDPEVKVERARSLKDARELLMRYPPVDLMMASQQLPDGSGSELLPGPGRDGTVPIVLLLDDGRQELIKEAMRAGAVDCIVMNGGVPHGMAHLAECAIRHWSLVNERQRLRQALRQSEKMQAIGQLVGGIAHDFNNQLAVIMGYSELLIMKTQDDGALSQYARHIRNACKKTQSLTQQLLAYARKGNYQQVTVDLRQLVGGVVAWLRQGETLQVEVDFDQAAQSVTGDPDQLHDVFLAIARNARQAVGETGRIRISTEVITLAARDCRKLPFELTPGDFVRASISDTGPGIAAEIIDRVFDPFFTTREPGEGTGMGLAAAYGTVVNHGGAIICDSPPGHGATFHVYLPICRQAELLSSSSIRVKRGQLQASILLVDDERGVVEVAREMLEALGHSVASCYSGAEAITYFKEHHDRVDLVLLDMVMPQMHGADVQARLRAIKPDVRVYICSGYSMSDDIERALAEGALGVLQKPFSLNALQAVLERELPAKT